MDFTLAFVLACLLIGLSKGGLIGPIGGTVALPLLVQASYEGVPISVKGAIGILLVLLLIGDAFAVPSYWKTWDAQYLWLTLPSAVAGVILGTWVLYMLDSTTLKHVLGLVTLALIAYKIFNTALVRYLKTAVYRHRSWHGYLAGVTSGIGSALANTGGPPMTMYMLLQKTTPSAFVGTLAVFFLIVNLLKIPGYMSGGFFSELHVISGAWWALLLIPAGVFGCRLIISRVNRDLFDWFITALLFWAALSLLR